MQILARPIFNLKLALLCRKILLTLLLATAALIQWTQAQTTPEHQVQAVFLFNFAQFVQWPENAFRQPGSPLVIGILGEDPFGTYLDEIIKGEQVNGHPLTIERYRQVEDIKTCHILFIATQKGAKLSNTLLALKDKPVLTVSDVSGFTRQGGMILFITEDGRIKLQINLAMAKGADLAISSKLLRLASVVTK